MNDAERLGTCKHASEYLFNFFQGIFFKKKTQYGHTVPMVPTGIPVELSCLVGGLGENIWCALRLVLWPNQFCEPD